MLLQIKVQKKLFIKDNAALLKTMLLHIYCFQAIKYNVQKYTLYLSDTYVCMHVIENI